LKTKTVLEDQYKDDMQVAKNGKSQSVRGHQYANHNNAKNNLI
jgi:hypothetical protein